MQLLLTFIGAMMVGHATIIFRDFGFNVETVYPAVVGIVGVILVCIAHHV